MAIPPGTHHEYNKDFCLKEYEYLRKEIEWLLTDARTVERNTLIAVGATWAWLFSNFKTVAAARWAWYIPVLFVALGALRSWGISEQFKLFHEYLKTMEAAFFADKAPEGWEHFSWEKSGWVTRSAYMFWTILFTVVVIISIRQACFP